MVLKKCFRTYGRTLVLVLNRMKLLETYETWKGAAYNHTCLDGIMMFFKRNVAGKGCFCGFFSMKNARVAGLLHSIPSNEFKKWLVLSWLTHEYHWNTLKHNSSSPSLCKKAAAPACIGPRHGWRFSLEGSNSCSSTKHPNIGICLGYARPNWRQVVLSGGWSTPRNKYH